MAWAPSYVTAADLRSYRRLGDTGDDVELSLAAGSASRAIDEATGRQFGKTDSVETRTYDAGWSDRLGLYVVEIDDIQTLAGLVVTVSGQSVPTVSGYRLYPRDADKRRRPWERLALRAVTPDPLGSGLGEVSVTATFGWTEVPDDIKNATLLQASRFFADRNMPHGIAGSPELGNEMRLLAKVHPDVEVMLAPYCRQEGSLG